VVFTPWLQGERSPVSDTYIRGGFDNVSLRTTRADLVRAVLEGVALNSAWLLRYVEKYAGQRLDPIRFVGGGAVSDLWCQIHADVFDRTIEQVDEPLHAQLRGAAILAGLALGDVERSEVRGLVPVARTFTPDAETGEVYRRHLDEVPRLYKARKAIHKRLNRRRP
jgi:xylulokinase